MSKRKKKRVNPNRCPMTKADLDKAIDKACSHCMAIFFTVLFDKHGATKEELKIYWKEVEDLSISVQ